MTKLDAFMRAEGLTDQAVAEMVGRERSTITKLRQGRTRPSLELALELERISKGRVTIAGLSDPEPKQRASA